MYIRITQTVKDRGVLVRPEELEATVTDRKKDWYRSPFIYGEDALAYWEEHKHSIKGYSGKVWTDTLYWDLDCKEDFSKAQDAAVKLLEHLEDLGLADGVETYFSGNKGVHVFLKTKNQFTPEQTSAICYNLAMKAGVDQKVFDTTVYNVNRIFRIVNTRHQESKLYKIQIDPSLLFDMDEKEIRDLAKEPQPTLAGVDAVEATKLIEDYGKKKEAIKNNVVSLSSLLNRGKAYPPGEEHPEIELSEEFQDDFNPMNCPRGKRRCIYVLENGYFGPGTRENALIRVAAYYKGRNYTYEQNFAVLNKALERRALLYPDASEPKEEDTHRILKEVYSDDWKGGTYSCRSTSQNPDKFLQEKCDVGNGPCGDEHAPVNPIAVTDITGLVSQYVDYGNEALKEYPKSGIEWLDKKVRIRPRNFSLINGANGSGKTSLMNNIVISLNKQKIYHIVFSLDMADTSLFEKLGATFTDYSQEQIESAFNVNTRNDRIVKEVSEALMTNLPYTLFDFTSAADARHLESTVNRLKKDLGIDIRVAFVDYAGRLIGDNDNEYANSSQNALMANDIAKRTDTHFIFLSQISRENGDHTTALRSSRIAKHSGAWEENATFILNVWRPFGAGLDGVDNYMHVYIAKNRSGSLGEHVFWWEGKQGQLREMDVKEFREYKALCEAEDLDPPYEQFPSDQVKKKDRRLLSMGKTEEPKEVDNDEEELPDSTGSERFS
mgnify:FL=1